MRRVGEVEVVTPFLEEVNFRRFEKATRRVENYLDMNGLDERTKEVIRYYKKLNGIDSEEEEERDEDYDPFISPRSSSQKKKKKDKDDTILYAKLLADLHRKV